MANDVIVETEIHLFNLLSNDKKFSKKWNQNQINNRHITDILSTATKSGTGENRGEPDLIYFNENNKILILLENKPPDRLRYEFTLAVTLLRWYSTPMLARLCLDLLS